MTQARVELLADSRQVRRATDDLRQLESRGKTTTTVTNQLRNAFVALGGALAIREIIRTADAYTQLQNQLRVVTKGAENLQAVYEASQQVAARTRSDIESTVDLYSKLARSTSELGLTQGELLRITETVNKTFAVAGASSEEASNAIRQLSQGLAAGALRGDEFNSVAEQAPGILRAVSQETGKSIGELRAFAAEGGITTELLVRALKNYADTADSEFGQANITVSQATTGLSNAFTDLIGAFDEANGTSAALASAIQQVGDTLNWLSDAIRSDAISVVFNQQLQIIISDIEATTDIIEREFGGMFDGLDSEFIDFGDAFSNIIPNVRFFIQAITVEIASFVDRVGVYGTLVAEALNPFDDISYDDAQAKAEAAIAAIDSARAGSLQLIANQREANINETEEAVAESERRIDQYKKEREARIAALGGEVNGDGLAPPSSTEPAFTKEQTKLRSSAIGLLNELEVGDDPAAQAEDEMFARLAVIDNALAAEAITKEEHRQAELLAEQAYQDELTRIDEESEKQRTQLAMQEAQARRAATESMLSGLSGVFGNFAEIAKQGGEETFGTYKALASAQAAISAAVAINRALADGGPFLGPALAVSIAALTGAQIAAINKQQYSPRALGGQVQTGGQYLVGERGPELITMGSNGNVTPYNQLMREARGGGGNAQIIINNNGAPMQVTSDTTTFTNGQETRIIELAVRGVDANIAGRKQIHSTITKTTTANNKVGA